MDDLIPDKKNIDINYHKLYYTILSNYLRKIKLEYDQSSCKYLFNNIHTIDKMIIYNNFYSININVGEDKFILYFVKYKISNNDKELGEFKNIVNIVPIESKILPTGQNSNIISMGNYICKIIEYYKPIPQTSINSNSTLTESCEKSWDDIKINDNYVFVGHCSNDVFPLNEINTEELKIYNLKDFPQESYLYS
jgi:hypothetical protein